MTKIRSCLVFFYLFGTVSCFGQSAVATTTVEEPSCYLKWLKKFEERGADDVADGTYTDVIVTFRSGNTGQCFNGKVEIKNNTIIAFYIKREDGTYEEIKKKLKYNGPFTIIGGVSQTMLTTEDELINIMFPNKIRPKKAGFQKAVEPKDD